MKNLIKKAIQIAIFFHRENMRKDGILPEVTHPFDVMKIAHKAGITDVNILCACVLHDTVEDTSCTIEYIKKELNEEIANIVKAMTHLEYETKIERKKSQVLDARSYSYESCIVRMCDKISNVSDRLNHPIGNEAGYVGWCNEVVKSIYNNSACKDKFFDNIYLQWTELYIKMEDKYGIQPVFDYYNELSNKTKSNDNDNNKCTFIDAFNKYISMDKEEEDLTAICIPSDQGILSFYENDLDEICIYNIEYNLGKSSNQLEELIEHIIEYISSNSKYNKLIFLGVADQDMVYFLKEYKYKNKSFIDVGGDFIYE